MGNWARVVQHEVLAQDNYESASIGRLRYIVHLDRKQANACTRSHENEIGIDNVLWTLNVDGSSNAKRHKVELCWKVLHMKYWSNHLKWHSRFPITFMNMKHSLQIWHWPTFGDSQFIVNQLNMEFEAREENMILYLAKVKKRRRSLNNSHWNNFWRNKIFKQMPW